MKLDVKNKITSPIIHSVMWVVLFSLHYTIIESSESETKSQIEIFVISLIPLFLFVVKFYINYYLLIDKFFFRKKYAHFILSNVVVMILLFIFHSLVIEDRFLPLQLAEEKYSTSIFIVRMIILFMAQIFPALAVKIAEKWYNEQQKYRDIEKAKVDMELQNLKNQLNPHFLFNSLNNIYAQISFDPKNAQASMLNICDLLRYQLYEVDTTVVPLEKEMKFIENYCNLMKLRLTENAKIKVSLPINTQGVKIAPLIFISLIENAFKHGVDSKKESFISIKISTMGDTISCIVQNSNYSKSGGDKSGSGIGIVNLKRRLELIYPHSHNYDVKISDDKYIATLMINTHKQ